MHSPPLHGRSQVIIIISYNKNKKHLTDKKKKKQETDQKQTLIFDQVQIDENARPPKSWKHMKIFPLKKTYEECVKATNNKRMLLVLRNHGDSTI